MLSRSLLSMSYVSCLLSHEAINQRQIFSAILVLLLVIIALTSTTWTKKLFGRGDEKTISISQPTLDQLNSLVEGHEDQIKALINDENVSEVLTMAQHLQLPIDVRRECNQTFVKCTADVKGSQIEAFIWMRHNVRPETCRKILNDVDFSSGCHFSISANLGI